MFNIDFKGILFQLTPHFFRTDEDLLRRMFSAIKPLQNLNNDLKIVTSFGQKNSSFYSFVLFIRNFIRFDARTIYLEKFLNLIYDSSFERIFIVNTNVLGVLYLFNKIEEREDVFFYNNWDSAFDYKINDLPITGDFVAFENKIYQAKTDNDGKQPNLNPSDWEFVKEITFLFNFVDVFPVDYIVDIPISVTLQPNYSNERIRAQINLLNAAGRIFALRISGVLQGGEPVPPPQQ